jgi:small acid-soluble spore protein K
MRKVESGMVDRGEKQYSAQSENTIQPRARDVFSSKRPDGTIRDRPMARMFLSNQARSDHED